MIDWLKRAAIEPEIDLGAGPVPITLRRHRTAKRLTLRLAPDGSEVRITLPSWAHANEAMAFAHARREWLAAQAARIPQREELTAGSTVRFRGTGLAINWQPGAPRQPQVDGAHIVIGGPHEGLATRIRRWLEKEALALFETDMRDYTHAADLQSVPVALSRAQRRWGSCSDQQRIRINWRLVQAPDFVRRSVVAHEVAHLVHFDHSPAFHSLLGTIYENDITLADRWLKEQGRSLYSQFG